MTAVACHVSELKFNAVFSSTSSLQMGLLIDLDPEEMMMGMEENLDDPALEAELASLTGNKAPAGGRPKQEARSECSTHHLSIESAETMN